jgi:hypothetical protein
MNAIHSYGVSQMTRLMLTAVVSFFLATVQTSQAGELVREFSGSRSTETAKFDVRAPWLLDWRVNSDYPNSMGIAVTLAHGETGVHAGNLFKTKSPGDGLRLVEEGGRFRFKVDAAITNWTLKVIQLTAEEAKQYTPKETLDY